jgi:hypothetical protein
MIFFCFAPKTFLLLVVGAELLKIKTKRNSIQQLF